MVPVRGARGPRLPIGPFTAGTTNESDGPITQTGIRFDAIRTVQTPLGRKDVATTMIYTHVAKQPGIGVRSPLDGRR